MKKRRWVLLLAAILLFTAFFTACGRPRDTGKKRLVVWVSGGYDVNYKNTLKKDPNNKPALTTKRIVDAFETECPDYTAVLMNKGWGIALNTAFPQALQAGTQVDVICGEVDFPRWIQAGLIADITELGEDFIGNLSVSAQRPVTIDGRTYGVSASVNSIALHVNLKVLREAGIIDEDNRTVHPEVAAKDIDPIAPATMEELKFLCEKIDASEWCKKNRNRGAIVLNACPGMSGAFRALAYMRQAGGDFVDEEGNLTLNSPENKKAYAFMRELCEYTPQAVTALTSEADVIRKVFNGYAAYNIDACDSFGWGNPDLENITVSPLPVFEDVGIKSNVLIGNGIYGVVSRSEHKEAAVGFLRVLVSDEVQLAAAERGYVIPSNLNVLKGEAIKQLASYPVMKVFFEPHLSEEYRPFQGLPAFGGDSAMAWQIYDNLISHILNKRGEGGTYEDLDALLDTAQKEMNAAITG